MTPYLRYQLDLAWRQDEARRREWETIRDESELLRLQQELRNKLLDMIGGLPEEKTDLHPEITGKIQRDGKAHFSELARSLCNRAGVLAR